MPAPSTIDKKLILELAIRVVLLVIFSYMETYPGFIRYLTLEELNNYKYPIKPSIVPSNTLWLGITLIPIIISTLAWFGKIEDDPLQSFLAVTLGYGINGIITDFVKIIAGRYRPDFFYRCFPNGVARADLKCTGNPDDVIDGRKSFPSGHSSFAFASLGFMSIWLCGRLGIFMARGRGSAPRILAALAPLMLAVGVAISRTCDYHHHWQDVLVGSILGLSVAYFSYRQHYHPFSSELAGLPYANTETTQQTKELRVDFQDSFAQSVPLLSNGNAKLNKWI